MTAVSPSLVSSEVVSHDIPGGAAWSFVLRRHRALTLTALAGGANTSMLMFDQVDPDDRLNVPDTLKAQMSARIRPPMVLMSDMGRALGSVTGSSLEWHDAITGFSSDRHLDRFGASTFGLHRNEWRRSARELLLDELAAYGLGARDLHAPVNWFTKVTPTGDERGTLAFAEGHAAAGDWVQVRAETDVLVVLCTAPHPLDPSPTWQPSAVRAEIVAVPAPGADDASRRLRPESARALAQTERTAP